MIDWEECLLKEANEIVKHGWGKLEVQAQQKSVDQVSVLVIAGKTQQFIVKKAKIID